MGNPRLKDLMRSGAGMIVQLQDRVKELELHKKRIRKAAARLNVVLLKDKATIALTNEFRKALYSLNQAVCAADGRKESPELTSGYLLK